MDFGGSTWYNFTVTSHASIIESELAGMTTDEGLVSDPTFQLSEVMVPPYLMLEGGRLYWSFAVKAETGEPLDHLLETEEAWKNEPSRALEDGLDGAFFLAQHHHSRGLVVPLEYRPLRHILFCNGF